MVVQHNIWAMNASRMVGMSNLKKAKSTERLSSGYKINRAADDAAGLAISEKMRKKIRGLEKGMENVEDGISLCQVADGALDEVTDLFQRVRELSIKAYNGTNSKSDREMIQDEIDQCIDEVDRIFETTKFNDIYVFHNGQQIEGTYLDTTPYTVTQQISVYKEMPSWLQINDQPAVTSDSKMEQHPAYTDITQDLSGIMMQDYQLADGSYVSVYFGADKGNINGYQWVGDFIKGGKNNKHELLQPGGALHDYIFAQENGVYKHIDNTNDMNYKGWTPTVTDNVSAKIDFSGLKNKATSASDLYNAVAEIVGAELAFPCGTCSKTEAIRYSGEYLGLSGLKFQDQGIYASKSELNLSEKKFVWNGKEYKGYFNAILEVMAMDDADPGKTAKTTALADSIAKDLTASTYSALNGDLTRHFDRAAMSATDPYSVYIYDYRDIDAATPDATKAGIRKYSRVSYDTDVVIDTGREVEYHYWDDGQIWIQASDGTPDGMPIRTGYLSIKRLGLKNYTINNYYSELTQIDPEGYEQRLQKWYDEAPDPIPVTVTKEIPMFVYDTPPVMKSIYEDGEYIGQKAEGTGTGKTVMKTCQITEYVYPNDPRNPKPTPEYDVKEIYDPTDLNILDKAMATVNETRSYYGASQNRLEHTYKNNANVHENLTAAESRIRDTDMAEEMVRMSLSNIVQQAGQAMLAQANQINQGVLSLIA